MVQKGLLMKGHFCAYLYALSLFFITLLFPIKTFAIGWTPSHGGLVVNLNQGDKILISVWVDKNGNGTEEQGEEFFINNYSRWTGGYFNYGAGLFLKLLPQGTDSLKPSDMSTWTVGAPLTRVDKDNIAKLGKNNNYDLGTLDGDVYTIWNDGRTLRTQNGNNNSTYQFLGNLTPDGTEGYNDNYSCDVVFIIPTQRSTITSFDPNKTLAAAYGRTDQDDQGRFNGKTGTGFLGMTYREVYMMVIPRFNAPVSYANAALVTFNTTLKAINNKWRNAGTVGPGKAAFAFADNDVTPSYHNTTRTVFRLYVVNDPINSCGGYFFATDRQDYMKYRLGPGGKSPNIWKWEDSTDLKKTYTMDRLTCMERIGSTEYYQTDYMYVPVPDSTYYYVGYNNDYRAAASGQTIGTNGAHSQFTKIRQLPIFGLSSEFKAPAGAYGRMVADETSSVDNLDVKFKPAGYFLKVSPLETNIRLRPNADSTIWTCEQMWHITNAYAQMQIKTTLFSGPEFSETDEGKDIEGWSVPVTGLTVPLASDHTQYVTGGMDGWARIYTDSSQVNGYMEFILANPNRHIHYDNNGLLGMQVPDQYPEDNKTKVCIEQPHLVNGFNFSGWTRNQDGTGGTYQPGDSIDLKNENEELVLYAQGTYTGTYHVAFSFMHSNGQRYYLTQPVGNTDRYTRARPMTDWTNTYQGMANGTNTEPNYISTYRLTTPPNPVTGEYLLDPAREMRHGAKDSLEFYGNWAPEKNVLLGLYFDDPETSFTDPTVVIANNTWAGLFTSSAGWPDYSVADKQNAKLRSTHYLPRDENDEFTSRTERPNSGALSYVKYNETDNSFDGVASENDATVFQISRVRVADEHYVVLPDTTTEWRNEITFGYHQGEQLREQVWSKLIGKQLMAVTKVGNDTVYFHPNPDKIINDPNNLYLSQDFRVTQNFELIHDRRPSAALSVGDSLTLETTSHYWHNDAVSGLSSPINVQDGEGNYIDIIDTIRIRLSHGGISKIKDYYGRWKTGATGLHVNANGSERYRDVLVRTKTYHYSTPQAHLVLTPEFSAYTFTPLEGNSRQINFTLTKVTTRQLLDVDENPIGDEEVVSTENVTSSLAFTPGACSFSSGGVHFNLPTGQTVGQHATISTTAENKSDNNLDTLIISTNVTIDAVTYPATARVPLVQTSLEGDELIWSVLSGDQRYYIMAGTDGLIFRKYNLSNSTLYKEGTTNTALIKGSKDATNSDTRYITPWHFTYNPSDATQLALKTRDGVNRFFHIAGETTPEVHETDSSLLTYQYVNVYTNDNANEEEQVKLKYGSNKWLQFTLTGGSGAELILVDNETEASVFSWSYLNQEYSLYQKNPYPNVERTPINSVTFGYNTNQTGMTVAVQTRYKAYKEYSMLVGNNVVYLCRQDEESIANLTDANKEWLTSYSIERISDARTFDGGAKSSGLNITTAPSTLTTTVSQTTDSPMDVKIGGKYVNIVDTLHVTLSLQDKAPAYRFKNDWKDFKSINDAELKIPLIRKTYHVDNYDSLVCVVSGDDYNHTFPNTITDPVSYTFTLGTEMHTGHQVLDVENTPVEVLDADETDVTISGGMNLANSATAEIRLMDDFGNTPTWCRITGKTAHTITVECTQSGIRSPRRAKIYIVYIMVINNKMRIVSQQLTVFQPSLFQYTGNQYLVHSSGASGDPQRADGMQQVHENKRILYYYPEQNVELPIRDSHFFGWWRWFREGEGMIGDSDIPDTDWRTPPQNTDKNYNIPFRTIGKKVPVDPNNPTGDSILVTMGRYTVFHYRSKQYTNVKVDPPCKTALVVPPITTYGVATKPTVTYAAEISNYYDNLPMSLSQKNQVDIALLDTIEAIVEPTLSLREVFELHPWTEMAARMDSFKTLIPGDDKYPNDSYMEDHVMMAPTGNELLLSTEQRYNYQNLQKKGHSESLLGYYMRDDHWSDGGWDNARKDSMIWCAGWDADCKWYTYNPKTQKYSICNLKLTESDDFLKVPVKENIPSGQEFDTVYYCLRAQSKSTTTAGTDGDPDPETPAPGAYMFNICRYKLIYHKPSKYGPLAETTISGITKALITNDEIEQSYEVLERLNFDYNQPGPEYTVYPHPLPWADASYGYTYPETPDLPHNRLHDHTDFPNHGEYGLINRIPDASHWPGVTSYWRPIEQHGGAENGYMIYCDGMSSSGQVAALSLTTHLCSGQKMFFSGYVCNPSSQTDKSDPNFTFAVQGSIDGNKWDDITSYTTGGIKPSDPVKWSQIYFPIVFNDNIDYQHFRVRIYNVSSDWDGNDFIIDDMCIFATKPPLIAYQANTACKEKETEETPSHLILRVDYQGIIGEGYNDSTVYYTIKRVTKEGVTSFVDMVDGYLNPDPHPGADESKPDTLCGRLFIPKREYEPTTPDSIFVNMNQLLDTFEVSMTKHKSDETFPVFKEGYIFENLDGDIRPVKYVVHSAYVNATDTFTVHMSAAYKDMLNSICGMTSHLKVSNQMVLELNDEEQPDTEQFGLCANSTYDISLRVKGSLYLDSVAPINLNGTCINDWLHYGDTAEVSSEARYGYKYSDIVKVIKDILRCDPPTTKNANQFAPYLAAVSRNEMIRIKKEQKVHLSNDEIDPYDVLAHLVNKGFLTLYQAKTTATVYSGDSVKFVIFPILGTGNDAMVSAKVDVCPLPILIRLKPAAGTGTPLTIGGLNRGKSEMNQPVIVLADATMSGEQIKIRVDSIMPEVGISSVKLSSTDDPGFREGFHSLAFTPDIDYPTATYYNKGDTITLYPARSNNYEMKQGYSYTFGIVMQTILGKDTLDGGCQVGTIPFTLSVVPDYLRWDPQDATSTQWNNPGNWIGVDQNNQPLPSTSRYAPLSSTVVIIPTITEGKPYPELPDLATPSSYDSVKQVGFTYNTCEYIRFLPGAAIGQQQRLNYSNAIIDMSTPQGKWAFRSAPVKGLISGDLFMANADLNGETKPWEVGGFDATGRNHNTGNASFWLSVYSKTTVHYGNGVDVKNDTTTSGEWSKVTNGLTLSLPPAQGWAIYTKTKSEKDAAIRLPKNDDRYYYFYASGDVAYDYYEQNLQSMRKTLAGGTAGKFAFQPDGSSQSYTLSKEASSTSFVFGNPTMGFIDIWGFLKDNNSLIEQISYIDAGGIYRTITKSDAEYLSDSPDTISNQKRYLPPMHAILITASSASASLPVTLNANRVVVSPSNKVRQSAPRRSTGKSLPQGIMTVTAINPVSNRCISQLRLGQGYHNAIISGEDAVLSGINIGQAPTTSNPATPFNIYAAEDGYGLSTDLLDSIVNVPISFHMSNLPYKPTTQLWFTGVNSINGPLVLYDALTDTERPIMDGICINIQTPETSHEIRYYIRRYGYKPGNNNPDVTTDVETTQGHESQAMKILQNGHVLILRNGHVYTMYGQQIK